MNRFPKPNPRPEKAERRPPLGHFIRTAESIFGRCPKPNTRPAKADRRPPLQLQPFIWTAKFIFYVVQNDSNSGRQGGHTHLCLDLQQQLYHHHPR